MNVLFREGHVPVSGGPNIELSDLSNGQGFAAHPFPADDCPFLLTAALPNNSDVALRRVARPHPRDYFHVGIHPRTLPNTNLTFISPIEGEA